VKSGSVEALYKYNLSKTSLATKFVQWKIFASLAPFVFFSARSAFLPLDAVTCAVAKAQGKGVESRRKGAGERSERKDQTRRKPEGQKRRRKALAKENSLIATRRQARRIPRW